MNVYHFRDIFFWSTRKKELSSLVYLLDQISIIYARGEGDPSDRV